MSQEATESILLESVVPDLEADGYEVFPAAEGAAAACVHARLSAGCDCVSQG